jgi:phosphatidylinositol kinase/protein kinase (PI-3  family)
MDNFLRSCAGWCVGTYILGIGDRHNDNILLTNAGHLFHIGENNCDIIIYNMHIDFGKWFGDWQKVAGIARDRVPFVLTAGMVYVINQGQSKPTEYFQVL